MKKTIAVLAVLLAAASPTACSSEDEPTFTWPEQVANPDAFAFRAVVGSTDGAPKQGTADASTATTLGQVWAKVGKEAADAAKALTAPPPVGGEDPALSPFAALTPAEVELLPAEVAYNVPYVHCGQLAELPREYPEPTAEAVVCDAENVKYLLRPVAINATGLSGAKVDGDPLNGGFKIVLQFTDAGAKTWADLTGAQVNNQVAMVLGDEVLSAPTIMQAITGGNTELTGGFTQTEAQELVSRINEALTN